MTRQSSFVLGEFDSYLPDIEGQDLEGAVLSTRPGAGYAHIHYEMFGDIDRTLNTLSSPSGDRRRDVDVAQSKVGETIKRTCRSGNAAVSYFMSEQCIAWPA